MKTQNGYCITHEYAGPRPVVQSRHRTISGALRELDRDYRAFQRRYPHRGLNSAIYPSVIRLLVDGQPGERVREVVQP
jgi:hypothetical protein